MRGFSRLLTALLPLALDLALVAGPAAAADFTKFDAACTSGGAFLLGETPAKVDQGAVLGTLCPCLETGFAGYTQPEIDALTADLRTGSSVEAKATYPAYGDLQAKASRVLLACFNTDAAAAALSGKPAPAPGG